MSIATEIQRLQTAKADIKAAIEEKGITVGDGTIDSYAAKIDEISIGGSGDYDQGYEDGKNSVADIARYMRGGTFKTLNMFREPIVVLNLDNWEKDFLNFLQITDEQYTNTTVEHLTINANNAVITSIQQMFYSGKLATDDNTLKHLILNFSTENCKNFNYTFCGNRALEIIGGTPFNFSLVTAQNNMFNRCYALIEFRVVANTIKLSLNLQWCDKLSTDTIQSIIDGLADLTGGTAQTLTLHATVGGKLTDEQKATITAKNWTLVY